MRRTPKLGQHLLTNPTVGVKVADAAGVKKGTLVLEVGPGKGALTAELLRRGANVIALEKDPAMVAVLRDVFAKELKSKQLVLHEVDARDYLSTLNSELSTTQYVVAANIPYYITGELIRTFLTASHQPTAVSLLVQKEVAERIARSKKESILSLSVKVYGTPKYVDTVKRGNFNPPPKVDSAILAITNISRNNFAHCTEDRFFDIVKAGFGQKRKTLAGNLKRVFGDTLGVADKIRAEDVPLAEWLTLAAR
jgi:16S rRNA (adenine1518-N6/adenine1519-N6)-dimethyltransferase